MRFRKAQRQATDPSFLFSTWPIPSWDGRLPFIQLEPTGGNDSPRIQQAVSRLTAVSGSLRLIEGVFRVSAPIDLSGTMESLLWGNFFLPEEDE